MAGPEAFSLACRSRKLSDFDLALEFSFLSAKRRQVGFPCYDDMIQHLPSWHNFNVYKGTNWIPWHIFGVWRHL
jgi:hypothetical protein